MLGAGRAGSTSYGSNVNMIQFGDRLQGLAPQATHFFISGNGRAGWNQYQTQTYAPKRNFVFCLNQLGGIGRGKSQFKVDGLNNPDGSKVCKPYEYKRLDKKDLTSNNNITDNTNRLLLEKNSSETNSDKKEIGDSELETETYSSDTTEIPFNNTVNFPTTYNSDILSNILQESSPDTNPGFYFNAQGYNLLPIGYQQVFRWNNERIDPITMHTIRNPMTDGTSDLKNMTASIPQDQKLENISIYIPSENSDSLTGELNVYGYLNFDGNMNYQDVALTNWKYCSSNTTPFLYPGVLTEDHSLDQWISVCLFASLFKYVGVVISNQNTNQMDLLNQPLDVFTQFRSYYYNKKELQIVIWISQPGSGKDQVFPTILNPPINPIPSNPSPSVKANNSEIVGDQDTINIDFDLWSDLETGYTNEVLNNVLEPDNDEDKFYYSSNPKKVLSFAGYTIHNKWNNSVYTPTPLIQIVETNQNPTFKTIIPNTSSYKYTFTNVNTAATSDYSSAMVYAWDIKGIGNDYIKAQETATIQWNMNSSEDIPFLILDKLYNDDVQKNQDPIELYIAQYLFVNIFKYVGFYDNKAGTIEVGIYGKFTMFKTREDIYKVFKDIYNSHNFPLQIVVWARDPSASVKGEESVNSTKILDLYALETREFPSVFNEDTVWLVDQSATSIDNYGSTLHIANKYGLKKNILSNEYMQKTSNGDNKKFKVLHWISKPDPFLYNMDPLYPTDIVIGCWVGSGVITLFDKYANVLDNFSYGTDIADGKTKYHAAYFIELDANSRALGHVASVLVANMSNSSLMIIGIKQTVTGYAFDQDDTNTVLFNVSDYILGQSAISNLFVEGIKPITARPILPVDTNNMNRKKYAGVTLSSGGFIVVEYNSTEIKGTKIYTPDQMPSAGLLSYSVFYNGTYSIYSNHGVGTGTTTGNSNSSVYRIDYRYDSYLDSCTFEDPVPIFIKYTGDSHGMVPVSDEVLVTVDRDNNIISSIPFNGDAVDHVMIYPVASRDIAMDLIDVGRPVSGSEPYTNLYASNRGSTPLTGNNANINNAQGTSAGISIIRYTDKGKTLSLTYILNIYNIVHDDDGKKTDIGDAHGILVL
jgi:hypothetical protein